MMWELSDLVGTGDIAALYKVTKSTVSNWTVRYPDFPLALTTIGGRPVYSRKQVEACHAEMALTQRTTWAMPNPNMARHDED